MRVSVWTFPFDAGALGYSLKRLTEPYNQQQHSYIYIYLLYFIYIT